MNHDNLIFPRLFHSEKWWLWIRRLLAVIHWNSGEGASKINNILERQELFLKYLCAKWALEAGPICMLSDSLQENDVGGSAEVSFLKDTSKIVEN